MGLGNNAQVTMSPSGLGFGLGGAITFKLLLLCHGLGFGCDGVGQSRSSYLAQHGLGFGWVGGVGQ